MNQMTVQQNNSNSLRHSNSFMPSIQELEQLGRLCHTLATAPFYQKLGAGGVLAIWLTARELNLPPMMALNGGLHNIEGKVSMSAQLMNMMIINAGHQIDVIYLNETGCAIRFTRVYRNGKTKSDEYEFNMKDANRAKYFGEPGPNGTMLSKAKANWTMYPRDMFFARALSGGAKKFLPEVMMNCYVFGEIEDAQVEDIQSSHEFVSNIVPINNEKIPQPEPLKNNESQSAIEPPKQEIDENQVNEFKEKFGIGKDSKHEEYLIVLSKKCKKDKNEMIVCAAMNETGFIEAFDKWQSGFKQKKEIEEENVNHS